MSSLRQRDENNFSSKPSEMLLVQQTGSRDDPTKERKQDQDQVTSISDPESQSRPASANGHVFDIEHGAEIHYKTCKWWHTSILLLAANVSLGVLALPQALAVLGLVPGLLCICLLGLIATYTGYILGEFKLAHPSVESYADCGMLIFGPIGREIFGMGQILVLIFVMGAHVLTFTVAMNALTDHGACTIVFSVVGLVVCFLLGLPRTFKNISYFSVFSCVSIIAAVMVALVGIGIQKPDTGNVLAVRPNLPVVKALGPVMNIILAYAGHVSFFSFQSELEDPREFKKALFLEQGIAVTFYMIISVVIYYFAGPLVASPALGSASHIVGKVAFGVAMPTIVIAGVVNGSVACKYIYLRVWKGTNVVHQKSWKSLGSWWAICAIAWVVAWLLAETIPNFNLFLGLIAALFGSWFSYAIPPFLWMYQHRKSLFSSKRKTTLTVFNGSILILGGAIFCLGMWSSGTELGTGQGGKEFSCANNWSPVSWIVKGNNR